MPLTSPGCLTSTLVGEIRWILGDHYRDPLSTRATSWLGGTPATKELAWRQSPLTVTASTEVAIADGSKNRTGAVVLVDGADAKSER
ncbi:hypothetical protein [Streptosporangium roseum]|uniref:hypothetical protein n=1 Tax=Streptosporangium roseum TaxID=2001 RepID=UPI0033334903